nr:unnamed protein product [Callosobruchus chinensis]
MHLHFERTVNAKSDCPILSLTWMGKVPDELPEDEGWKLNRTNYYQEGWLATGNVRGIVGVTFTTSHCKKSVEFPLRTNYNLRGHRSEVILVKWNEPYQKLASCDSSGIIFVWIKYEGRWSIELINDRNTPVTHFSWSHDGRMALICYQDGFVLVGSVAGQRYWSSMLNLEATVTCGIWTPDDQQVYFGTAAGQLVVMDVHGAMVAQVQLAADVAVTAMAWSCEKFKMEETDETDDSAGANGTHGSRKFVLAVALQNGFVLLLNTFDDVSPTQIDTGLQGPVCMEWSNSREYLAVAGVSLETTNVGANPEYKNLLKFYNEKGILLYSTVIPDKSARISTLTWGHNDKRLFLATGTQIHIAWVSKRIASLQLLCRLTIHNLIRGESQLAMLPLPMRLRNSIGNLFAQTIRCCVPEPFALREFVSRPPVGSVRLHCTMIRHDEENHLTTGTCYTLYLEYLGGLVPLLKGKRTSKIRPEFVIFDPQLEDFHLNSTDSKSSSSSTNSAGSFGGFNSDSSDTEREDGCTGSPRVQRRKRRKHKTSGGVGGIGERPLHWVEARESEHEQDLAYVDTLPEQIRLVEVTSNIWGTKFKIHGLATSVPANLGQVTYKTSLLHLQPRQMTLVMTELRDDFPAGPDPTFNPNVFSEDEEEAALAAAERQRNSKAAGGRGLDCPPIAPMSPRAPGLAARQKGAYMGTEHVLRKTDTHISVTSKPDPLELSHYSQRTDMSEMPTSSTCSDYIRPPPVMPTCGTSATPQLHLKPGNVGLIAPFGQNGGSQRHAISPICCEASVPALQSPKNAVAPSDIIFDRPPASTVISYSTSEYFPPNFQIRPSSYSNTNDLRSSTNGPSHSGATANSTSNSSNNTNVRSGVGSNHSECATKCGSLAKNCSASCSEKQSSSSTTKELKFIDEEPSTSGAESLAVSKKSTHVAQVQAPPYLIDSMVRSCSVGFLDTVDAHLVPSDESLHLLCKDIPKRLVLVNKKPKARKQSRLNAKQMEQISKATEVGLKLKSCGKSRSLDSSDIFPNNENSSFNLHRSYLSSTMKNKVDNIPEIETISTTKGTNTNNKPDTNSITVIEENSKNSNNNNTKSIKRDFFSSPLMRRKKEDSTNNEKNRGRNNRKKVNANQKIENTGEKNGVSIHTQALANLEKLITRLREDDSKSPPVSPRLPKSSPSSPAPTKKGIRPQSASPIRRKLLNSPLLGRRSKKSRTQESSDDEVNASGDEIFNGTNYKDLETFQKSQLRQKLKRGRIEPNGSSNCNNQTIPQRREFVMHNKAPMWNENSQVYQLDFGGRVTQESAKNFQIEFRGKQVMQFGRIDGNAYTLDFQYPFSALQAFAVALANVTQRLK